MIGLYLTDYGIIALEAIPMMASLRTVPTDADIATDIVFENRQMFLPFDLSLTTQTDATEDLFAIDRWEDDGGPVGREKADGE
jgi:hypothetical protein